MRLVEARYQVLDCHEQLGLTRLFPPETMLPLNDDVMVVKELHQITITIG